MKIGAAAVLIGLACSCGGKDIGDRPSIHPLDAGYSNELGPTLTVRLYGTVREVVPGQGRPALGGAEVCVPELFDCDRTGDDGAFVLEGEMTVGQQATLIANAVGMPSTVVPFTGPVDGDRNLATVVMLSHEVLADASQQFGVSLAVEESGLLLISPTYFGGSVTLESGDATTLYTLDHDEPSSEQQELIESAIIPNLPPGTAHVTSPLGRCDPGESGWPSETGDFSAPIEAGRITFVQPLCIGD